MLRSERTEPPTLQWAWAGPLQEQHLPWSFDQRCRFQRPTGPATHPSTNRAPSVACSARLPAAHPSRQRSVIILTRQTNALPDIRTLLTRVRAARSAFQDVRTARGCRPAFSAGTRPGNAKKGLANNLAFSRPQTGSRQKGLSGRQLFSPHRAWDAEYVPTFA